jgi:hypothetical protein
MERRLLLGIVMVVAVAGMMGAAQANISGNCCWGLTPSLLTDNDYAHQMGQCHFNISTYEGIWEARTCNAAAAPYSCGNCGHYHADDLNCAHIQSYCYQETGHTCGLGLNTDTGDALKCHKKCPSCSCTGNFSPEHIGP